ncbi:DUF4147 domain-containing protein [Caldiplasma sukawensis]
MNTDEISLEIISNLKKIIKDLSPENLVASEANAIREFFNDGSVTVFSLGKAAETMMRGIDNKFHFNFDKKICITNEISAGSPCFKGNHPVPDKETFESSIQILNMLREDSNENLLVLLSGGSSSIFEVPEDNYSHEYVNRRYKELLYSGLSIEEINLLRGKISKIKLGKILKIINYKKIYELIISDVPSDNPYFVGSNPFLPELKIDKLPIKYENSLISYKIILNGRIFSENLRRMFSNYNTVDLENILKGDVYSCSNNIVSKVRKIYSELKKPFFFTGYGETASKVTGDGMGGRNCMLSFLIMKEFNNNEIFSVISFASDGQDGNSGLAGAIVNTNIKKMIDVNEIDKEILNSNTGGLAIKYNIGLDTGPTGNNVSDILIGFYGGETT